jgi:site-specific recombinase XerC
MAPTPPSREPSPKTIKSYREAAEQMTAFLINKGMPTNITSVSGEHVEAFVIGKMERTSAATAATRYRGLQQFFGWLVDEGEITTNLRQQWSPAGGGSRAGIGRRRP